MNDAQMFGVKFDSLGLKNLDIINDCLNLINKKIEDIDVNDNSIYEFLDRSDYFYGIFQAEESLGKYVMKTLKCKNIEDLVLSIAIGRPGSVKFLQDIVKAREKGEYKKWHPIIDNILKSSYGVIVYQEDIMSLCKVMANFTPLETNEIRKIIGKKLDTMPLWKEKFVNQSIDNGFDEKICEEIWETFEMSSNYIFNKCLSLDTVVETKNGKKTMLMVKVGEFIKAYDIDNNNDIYVKIINKFENFAELYEIELQDGRIIKCSINHKFLT